MERVKQSYIREIITSVLGILILIVLIFGTSYAVEVKSSDEKINTLTMGYLSFNFTESNNNTINIINAKPMSDTEGMKITDKDLYYEFSVSNDFDKSINYEILLEPIVNEIDGEYIKFYLTDKDNKPVSNYSNNVLSLMKLEDSKLDGNKVLYKDVLKPKTNKKFTLRIWVSDKYQESTDNLSLSFKVDVKGTTKDME